MFADYFPGFSFKKIALKESNKGIHFKNPLQNK